MYSRVGLATPRIDISNGGNYGERTSIPGDTFHGDVFIRGFARLGPTFQQTGWHFVLFGNMTLEADENTHGLVDADLRGFPGGQGPGAGFNTTGCCTSGASHGGLGGRGRDQTTVRPTYGSMSRPIDLGSGGGNGNQGSGGSGGGALRLSVAGVLTVNGFVRAGGSSTGNSGAGSGGSVWITCGTLAGTGRIHANGGGADSNGGGGGGGRVAIYACFRSTTPPFAVEVAGGSGNASGGMGTVVNPAFSNVTVEVTPARNILCRRANATFSAGFVLGGPNAMYLWYRNDEPLEDGPTGTGSIIVGSQSSSLMIQSAGAPDVANYRVTVQPTNSACGPLTSNVAILTFCIADFNCSGLANSQDFFDFLSCLFQQRPECDINMDGFVNSQDFFDFITAFFTPC